MKRTHWLSIPLLLLSAALLLSACSAPGGAGYDAYGNEAPGAVGSTDTVIDETAKDFTDAVTSSDSSVNVAENRKIIETVSLSLQTTAFDELIDGIHAKVKELGGYVEQSSVSGREISATNNRYASLTVRIPAAQSESFTTYVSDSSTVTRRTVSTEDVTLTYVDIESRITALEAEKEALESLLSSAASVEEIIKVQDRLTDVIYQIESYQSQLRTYDNLIDYCTVELSISEVERTTPVAEQDVWGQIGSNLTYNFGLVWDILVGLFVLAVSAIPFFLPPLVIALLVIAVVVIVKKLRRQKRDRSQKNDRT